MKYVKLYGFIGIPTREYAQGISHITHLVNIQTLKNRK